MSLTDSLKTNVLFYYDYYHYCYYYYYSRYYYYYLLLLSQQQQLLLLLLCTAVVAATTITTITTITTTTAAATYYVLFSFLLMPIYNSWLDCWSHLSATNQLKRGNSLLWRYYMGPQVIINGKPIPINKYNFHLQSTT